MHTSPRLLPAALLAVLLLVFGGCTDSTTEAPFGVMIRLPNEPESLNPIFSRSIYASQVEGLIMPCLAEYDPVSLTLSPLLITEIPAEESNPNSAMGKGSMFRLAIRPEATWDDGKPVTSEDYLFTLKAVYNPHMSSVTWRSFMDYISAVEPDAGDPKKFTVYLDSTFMLATEAVTNFNLYPAHQYDPNGIMARFTLEELRDPAAVRTPEQDSLLKTFAAEFESPAFAREQVRGCGPYTLSQWTTGETIQLKRKADWWGDKIEDLPLLLQAHPDEITYRIILDEAAAEAGVKAGELDLMAEVPAASFVSLREDPTWGQKLQFATPQLMQVNYIEMNTRDSILADRRIRQALAHCIDYEGIIDQVLKGLAQQAVGPVHPSMAYFNQDLKPLRQDVNKAIELIRDAGWTDTNGNGTPDKQIGGTLRELQLTIKVSGKEEGNAIATIVKANAAKAGFDIVIETVESGQMTQDIRQNNFQLLPLRIRSFPSYYDPHPAWHSASDRPGGSNRSGYHSPELDAEIEAIRASRDAAARNAHYRQFQELLYDAQPSIFLYVPTERIIASRAYEIVTTPRRPCYFENLIRPAG